jgi:hypothetical protein
MLMERRHPTNNTFPSIKREVKGTLIKVPKILQDLRRKIYIKVKAEKGRLWMEQVE